MQSTLTRTEGRGWFNDPYKLTLTFYPDAPFVVAPDSRPCRVVFRGGPTPPLPQCLLTLFSEETGPLELFLVPAAPDEQGPQYVAVLG